MDVEHQNGCFWFKPSTFAGANVAIFMSSLREKCMLQDGHLLQVCGPKKTIFILIVNDVHHMSHL